MKYALALCLLVAVPAQSADNTAPPAERNGDFVLYRDDKGLTLPCGTDIICTKPCADSPRNYQLPAICTYSLCYCTAPDITKEKKYTINFHVTCVTNEKDKHVVVDCGMGAM